MYRVPACVAALAAVLAFPSTAFAEASGPDYWNVRGVRASDVLNLHVDPSARSRTIAGIPHDAKGLKNLGCRGGLTFQEWQRASDAERARGARARWCKVEFANQAGWVAGRFLAEGEAPAAAKRSGSIGPWTIACKPTCVLEQAGVGVSRPTLLRIERRGENADITIVRRGIARSGTLAIYMDGDTVTQGSIAPLAQRGGRIVLAADDITLGILKRMRVQKNMVLSFPGEDRGVEIHLDRFEEAWNELGARAGR